MPLPAVIRDFFPQTQLNLFSSVTPEYSYGGKDPYVFDLNLENTHGITRQNYKEKLDSFINHLESKNYPRLSCSHVECPWKEFCQNVKWYWQDEDGKYSSKKLQDYCRFKRLISDTYYRILVDSSHETTVCKIGDP